VGIAGVRTPVVDGGVGALVLLFRAGTAFGSFGSTDFRGFLVFFSLAQEHLGPLVLASDLAFCVAVLMQ
jgi:hypothetical protein